MKKLLLGLLMLTSFSALAVNAPTYECTAGAGYKTMYLLRSSKASSRAEKCALEKCYEDGNRVCSVLSTKVRRVVLSSEIYYRATSIVQAE